MPFSGSTSLLDLARGPRHTPATLLLAQGAGPGLIMGTLRVSQINSTMNAYSHVLPALRFAAVEKMDALLSGCCLSVRCVLGTKLSGPFVGERFEDSIHAEAHSRAK